LNDLTTSSEDKVRTSGIKHWPKDDRPREKLLKKGPAALSNSELLVILLRTGVAGASAIDLARRMLDKFGTFRNMSHTDTREWKEFKGLGPAKPAQIKAALEIGRRFREDEAVSAKQKIAAAQDVVTIVLPQIRDLETEVSKVVYLNSDSRIIDICDAATGTVNHAMPIVREIIHTALQKYYFWLRKTRELRNINMGAAQPNLNTDILKNYLLLRQVNRTTHHQLFQEMRASVKNSGHVLLPV
jgi:DNA repair protein RadC